MTDTVSDYLLLLGTEPSWDLMMNCDTLLMVGSSFPYSEFLPKPGRPARVADRILASSRRGELDVRARTPAPLCG
ncbi:MAG: hypothetical protein LC804_21265 [Acidobacteria bacterium]|nr:hypothetical protein [Acidobacteriota bacterium]